MVEHGTGHAAEEREAKVGAHFFHSRRVSERSAEWRPPTPTDPERKLVVSGGGVNTD